MPYIIHGDVAVYGGSNPKDPENPAGVWDAFLKVVEIRHGFKIIDGREHHLRVWLEWKPRIVTQKEKP